MGGNRSDQKGRSFNLHKSHIADPKRLARLMIAACLAYIWIIHLGVVAKRDGWVRIIHRTDRCDLSLFQTTIYENTNQDQGPECV